MFCPNCGSEERQASQFCRGCGADLRAVRVSLERPDSITASAVSAREEIGRAVAEKIRAAGDAVELKIVAEDVLPKIEKFLESPEGKRMRRMRAGVIVSAVGFGATILMFLMSTIVRSPENVEAFVGGAGLGIITFCIGLGLLINAVLFTRPRKTLEDHSANAQTQNQLDSQYTPPQLRSQTTSDLRQANVSVTEHTTHHLNSQR